MSTYQDQKIKDLISEIEAVQDRLPGVIIIHDLSDWSVVWISSNGLEMLDVTKEEITNLTYAEYHSRFFNPDDSKDYVPKVIGLLERNNDNDFCTFFQQVRFSENFDWNWHMSSIKIFARDNDGNPLMTITIALPIDSMHHMTVKASRLLEENNFLRKNFHEFSKLGKREREVLKHMALGKSSAETADELFISLNTVETHRKNIKKKLTTNSFYELCQYARAFDLI